MRFIIWFLLAFMLNYVTSIGSFNTQSSQIRSTSRINDNSHSSTEILFTRTLLDAAHGHSSQTLLNDEEDILENSDGVIDGFTSASLKLALTGNGGGSAPSASALSHSQFGGEEVKDVHERSSADTKNYSSIITSAIHFDTPLNHLVVDTFTGRVFVGGVNFLYQLSPELELHEKVKTGPRNDSVECTVLDCPAHAMRRPTDNYNKVLLIDRATSRLIACGSLFQGTCTVRNLQNVSIVEQDLPDAVVANDANSSTVAFIAPGPPQPPITNVMYVGVTYTNNSPYRSEIPAVASRSLEKTKMFQIASSAVTTGTRTFINSYAREGYLINYVYGFSSERFSYFLTTQLKHNYHSSPKEYITKLVRICQEDSNYYSYTEIPIDCITGGTKYNLVQAGYLGKPSADLAGSLGITVQDDVLYGVFSVGDGNVSTDNSALCIYSLKSIRRKFMQNIKSCFNGVGSRGLGFISPNMPCVPTVWLDYKCYIKRKRSANKAETRATGGGPNRMHNFNELEEKVIELTGLHTSTSGINGAVSFGVVTTQTVTQPVVEPAAVVPMPTEPDNANVQRHSPPLKKRQGHFGTGANKFATKLLPKKFGLFRADNVRLTYQVQENMYDMKKEKLRKLKRHNIEMEALKRRELDLQEKLLRIQERSQHK